MSELFFAKMQLWSDNLRNETIPPRESFAISNGTWATLYLLRKQLIFALKLEVSIGDMKGSLCGEKLWLVLFKVDT